MEGAKEFWPEPFRKAVLLNDDTPVLVLDVYAVLSGESSALGCLSVRDVKLCYSPLDTSVVADKALKEVIESIELVTLRTPGRLEAVSVVVRFRKGAVVNEEVVKRIYRYVVMRVEGRDPAKRPLGGGLAAQRAQGVRDELRGEGYN